MNVYLPIPRGRFCALLFLASISSGVASSAAEPGVRLYRGGNVGVLRVRESEGRLLATQQSGGGCGFDSGSVLFSGVREGNVWLGDWTVCQTGEKCGAKAFPFLGIELPDGSLVGQVKVDPGCQWAGSDLRALELMPLPAEAPAPSTNSKLKTTGVSPSIRKKAVMSRALLQGQRLLRSGALLAAAEQFRRALEQGETWQAHHGLGVAQFRLGETDRAIASFRRALAVIRVRGEQHPEVAYNLACAQGRLHDRKAALEALREAVREGFARPEQMSSDPDLTRLLQGDPEFAQLINAAWTLQDAGGRLREKRP